MALELSFALLGTMKSLKKILRKALKFSMQLEQKDKRHFPTQTWVLPIITEDFWRNLLNARRKHLGFTDRMEISEMCKVLSPI